MNLNLIRHKVGPLFLCLLLLLSCKVQLISKYDEITDRSINNLQEKVTKILLRLDNEAGTPEAAYSNYQSSYEDVKVDLNTVKIRAAAIDKNTIVQNQLILLDRNIQTLDSLHRKGLQKAEIPLLQSAFNQSFTALVKLQMALKRGESKN